MNVILLHGLGRSRFSMSRLASSLRRAGMTAWNFGYPSLRRSIPDHAARVYQLIERSGISGTPLSFVTHSLGSLVVRELLAQHGPALRPHRIVMLGPPNQGAEFARSVARIPCASLILGPSFRSIAAGDLPPAPQNVEVGVIAGGTAPFSETDTASRTNRTGYSPFISGDNDGIVSLAETELPGMKERVVVRCLHSFLMYRPEVHDLTLRFLTTGSFQRGASGEQSRENQRPGRER